MSEAKKVIEAQFDVKPITLEDSRTGRMYTLEFSRDSIRFAERQGFKISEVTTYPETGITSLFFYAFRMHHPNVNRRIAEELIAGMGGISPEVLERLVELYQLPLNTLIRNEGDGDPKNATVTVTL